LLASEEIVDVFLELLWGADGFGSEVIVEGVAASDVAEFSEGGDVEELGGEEELMETDISLVCLEGQVLVDLIDWQQELGVFVLDCDVDCTGLEGS